MKKLKLFAELSIIIGILILNLNAFSQDYKVVETGQTSCYDEDGNVIACPSEGEPLYGQDAQFPNFDFSFVDNGDGTVSDLNTGLMWQQVPTNSDFKWQAAVDYCNNLVLDGYDDWRMPSAKELFSISDFNSGWPYIDLNYFTLASGQVTKDEQYWTSNYYVGVTVEGGSQSAFGVNHVTGHIKAYAANSGGPVGGKYVRAVRGNVYGENEFVDNGDGTITDNATQLMWTQDDNEVGIDWQDALAYAEDFELAGHSDWRLPNVKELQSIVDYSYSPTATDEAHQGPAINPMFNCTPILNEAGIDDYGYYWTNTSAHFTTGEPYYYAWYVAFGTAVNGEGLDFHGAGAVRFDTKYEGGPLGEGGERYYNFVFLVRNTGATGLNESKLNDDSFKIYPNPATGYIKAELSPGLSENSTVQVLNLMGEVIYSKNMQSSNSLYINLLPYNPGIYFFRVISNESVFSKKFIKK